MRMYDVIKKKRDGDALSEEEIDFFVKGYTDGSIPDYQAAALLMAISFCGMNDEETLRLTLAIANSGKKLELSNIKGFRVDKHSSGGVGDKTSLVVAPVAASLGVKVAKMSGRGLGHTGGTIDKLESIPGLKTDLSKEDFEKIVNETGLAIAGQSATLAPADKKLYALRDVTATVDVLPLIASSIMGKKLAAADNGIVLDVKVGSGSFNKTVEQASKLARVMVNIGNGAGIKTVALLTDMDKPLGRAVGNSLEVIEAIEALRGKADDDFMELCMALSAEMLSVSGLGSQDECRKLAGRQIENGEALRAFRTMVGAQGGDVKYVDDPSLFAAGIRRDVQVESDGYITAMDTEKYGLSSLALGAGRSKKDDVIDYSAGIKVLKKTGDEVRRGETVAEMFTSDEIRFGEAERLVLSALTVGKEKPAARPVVLGRIE